MHIPVMANEAVQYLQPAPGKVFVDCTLGGGGHTEALGTGVRVIAFDRDRDAIEAAKKKLAAYNSIEYIHDNFANLKKHVKEKVDGILFDLGVSSDQIDTPARGFSFRSGGLLDMRMDASQKLTAAEIVNDWPPGGLEKIFKEYGEERFAKRISNGIRATRTEKPIKTTLELKEIIEKAIPTWKKRESVTRIFQALRLAVNSELNNLSQALKDAVALLRPGGRIVVISYHSLEDRIVKHAFRAFAQNGILKIMTKKPLPPAAQEIEENPRAKSAKLRAAEKL